MIRSRTNDTFPKSDLPERILFGNLMIGWMSGKIENPKDKQYTTGSVTIPYHEDWELIMEAVEYVEKEEDYYTNLETIGLGIYEFSLNRYFREDPNELDLPEGLLIRTDERAPLLDDVKLQSVWEGLKELAKFNWGNR